jgi:hypothetical protein
MIWCQVRPKQITCHWWIAHILVLWNTIDWNRDWWHWHITGHTLPDNSISRIDWKRVGTSKLVKSLNNNLLPVSYWRGWSMELKLKVLKGNWPDKIFHEYLQDQRRNSKNLRRKCLTIKYSLQAIQNEALSSV